MQTATNLQIEQFKAAHKIAIQIAPGYMRRARHNGTPCNYFGFKDSQGLMWVLADSEMDLPMPDRYIKGRPARQVFIPKPVAQ